MSEFNSKRCGEIKGNAVILTNENTAYFIFKGKVVNKDGKPHAVEGINRQGIARSHFAGLIEYTDSPQKKREIVSESTLKGGHALFR